MCYVVEKVMSKLELKDASLPVILRDPDGWMSDRVLSEIKKERWKIVSLKDMEDEFFTMIEAERLKKQGENIAVYVGNLKPSNFVHLAEYWDKGNKVELHARKFITELGVRAKDYSLEEIVSILKIGMLKGKKWWENVGKKGIDVILDDLEDRIWDLIENPASWDEISEEEKNLILADYLPTRFDLKVGNELKGFEIVNRLEEKILKSYFIDYPSYEIKRFYEKWEDSKEMESSLLNSAKNFEEMYEDVLLKNKDKMTLKPAHPFFKIERKIFDEKVRNFLKARSFDEIEFAKRRSESRKSVKEFDVSHGIYWDEFASLEPIFEKRDLSKIDSLEGIIKAYQDFIWKFDRLDRMLKESHLPEELARWARGEISKVLNEMNMVWMEFYDPMIYEKTEQAGLIKRILESESKQAVIVADAFRYELAASIDLKRAGIEKQINAVIAMTPTVTPIGMGALFSSGNVKKEYDGKNFFIVEKEMDKKVSDVKVREENVKRMIDGVGVYRLNKRIPSKLAQKAIFISRDVDEAGHGGLIELFSNIVEEISEKIKELVKRGYTVHLVSDHGFCLLNDDRISEEKDDAFHSSGRYKMVNKAPQNAKYEEVGSNFVVYADYGNTFEKNGIFFHGGISIGEVLIPHAIFRKNDSVTKVKVSIENKEMLKVLRKQKVKVVVGSNNFFVEPRMIYVEVKGKKFYSKKAIHVDESFTIVVSFEAENGEKFKIDLYDADDGTHLDSVEVTYLPLRQELF